MRLRRERIGRLRERDVTEGEAQQARRAKDLAVEKADSEKELCRQAEEERDRLRAAAVGLENDLASAKGQVAYHSRLVEQSEEKATKLAASLRTAWEWAEALEKELKAEKEKSAVQSMVLQKLTADSRGTSRLGLMSIFRCDLIRSV